jgi:calcium-dependent protein kinase
MEFYDLHQKLGAGSYGSVHRAVHRQTGDEFACKVISMTKINSHSLRKLHEEISIMKSLDHPNIIKLREVFFGSKTVYLVMELCRGGELFDKLTKQAPRGLADDRARQLMTDMFSAVRYLHSHNIVHRDLKLENFLFLEDGDAAGGSSLKLIDFGLSKHCDTQETMHHVVGSAYYIAPEVLAGNYDHRCDVWSLGVICYILLTGQPPFTGVTGEQVYKSVCTSEPDFSSTRFAHVRPATVDFVRRLLVKDPDYRMTIDEAFEHPFLKPRLPHSPSTSALSVHSAAGTGDSPTSAASSSPRPADVTASLSKFMKMGRFKRLMLEVSSLPQL